MKLGISVKIDVTKIDKSRLFQGKKGTYLDLTTFIDTEQLDQYENNGFISQSVSKEERDQNIQTPILGNCKVFYNSDPATPMPNNVRDQYQQQQQPPQAPAGDQWSDDIPF